MTTPPGSGTLVTSARNATLEELAGILRTQRARQRDIVIPGRRLIMRNGLLVVPDATSTLTDTGVSQIYAYDTKSKTYARITTDTSDPLGCTLPSTFKIQQDWRVAFVCSGVPYYYMLRGDQGARHSDRLAIDAVKQRHQGAQNKHADLKGGNRPVVDQARNVYVSKDRDSHRSRA